ncbi:MULTISPECIES: hemolysin family protein [Arthrobacter]|uniref:Hemolysin family protein n=2 Tax=Arthrobacter TaxID=1663 RepID=A0ABU9KGJ2_9MICC|nr:hemolysin family protein [Arthrobacter sp. YJM1]MDP5226012.1 hemolysin family protein [Arthrobacter sp. YJM1]
MTLAVLLLLTVLFLVVGAVLSAAESALAFLPRHDLDELRESRPGDAVDRVFDDPQAHLRALRFWRVWFEMAGAVALTLAVTELIDNLWLTGLIATAVMAVVGFVLVGVSPRRLGRQHPEGTVRHTAWLVHLLRQVLGPVPDWLQRFGAAVLPGSDRDVDLQDELGSLTGAEVRALFERSSDSELIEEGEAELIQSVFDLEDTLVRAVMVPRTDIVHIHENQSLEQAMRLFLRSGSSRVPVVGESADDVLGILYLKDVAAALFGSDAAATGSLAALARPVRFVPESKPVAELLKELQLEQVHMAIVIDEYGGTAGLVTLEDLIEEIVGEIVDEYDSEAAEAVQLVPGTYRVSARMPIDHLGELFDKDIEDDDVDSVGGLLAKALGRVPILGSVAYTHGLRLEAHSIEGRRNRVNHVLAQAAPDADNGGATAREEVD